MNTRNIVTEKRMADIEQLIEHLKRRANHYLEVDPYLICERGGSFDRPCYGDEGSGCSEMEYFAQKKGERKEKKEKTKWICNFER